MFICFQSYLIYLRTGLAATMAMVGKKGENAGGGAVAITQGRTNIRLRTHNVRVRAGTALVVVSPTRNAAVFLQYPHSNHSRAALRRRRQRVSRLNQ